MQVWLIPIADERVGVQVKLWNPLRTRAIPERFCGGDSLRRGAISSVWTFTWPLNGYTDDIDISQYCVHKCYTAVRIVVDIADEIDVCGCMSGANMV